MNLNYFSWGFKMMQSMRKVRVKREDMLLVRLLATRSVTCGSSKPKAQVGNLKSWATNKVSITSGVVSKFTALSTGFLNEVVVSVPSCSK